MSTRLLMSVSAVVMGLGGGACLFAPDEILTATHAGGSPSVLQLLGALFFAFAMMNWTAKDSLIGGIYNRPVALGNLTHFTIGAISIVKMAAAGALPHAVWVVAIVYVLFAVAFARVFFTSPVQAAA